jgi:hypothetical protein
VAIAGGRQCSVALDAQGAVWTWGWNGFGQLGTGTTDSAPTPVAVRALGRVVALAQGSESMHQLVLVAGGPQSVAEESPPRGQHRAVPPCLCATTGVADVRGTCVGQLRPQCAPPSAVRHWQRSEEGGVTAGVDEMMHERSRGTKGACYSCDIMALK